MFGAKQGCKEWRQYISTLNQSSCLLTKYAQEPSDLWQRCPESQTDIASAASRVLSESSGRARLTLFSSSKPSVGRLAEMREKADDAMSAASALREM